MVCLYVISHNLTELNILISVLLYSYFLYNNYITFLLNHDFEKTPYYSSRNKYGVYNAVYAATNLLLHIVTFFFKLMPCSVLIASIWMSLLCIAETNASRL